MSTTLVYALALAFCRTILNIFFREIRSRGAYNIPRTGPVIFAAAPHHNQFLDVLLASQVWNESHRHVGFIVAASSMRERFIGTLGRLLGAIAVERAQDVAKAGKGFVYLDNDDPTLLHGINTSFTAQLGPKNQILLPKAASSAIAQVAEVLSDTEARLKGPFSVGDGAIGTKKVRDQCIKLRKDGKAGLDYKVLPHIDHHEMYEHVYDRLKSGGAIGIFPEGGSHDRTDLLPFKAGIAIMALGAMASDPNLKVQIVPCGLSYFHAHKFRSRVVIEFGQPFEVPQELVEQFKAGGEGKRLASARLLEIIYDALKTVTVRAPDYDTLQLIQASRRLYNTPGQHLTLSQVVQLNRRFIEGYLHFQDEPRIQALKQRVIAYNEQLHALGLRDHQVEGATRAAWKSFTLLVYRTGLVLTWTIFALPGVILNGPIFIVAAYMSEKKAKEALAKSVVKVAARDVMATWKVLVFLALTPILYTIYAIIGTYIAYYVGAETYWVIATPFITYTVVPVIGYCALKFGEAGMDVYKSLPPLVLAVLPGQHKRLEKLKQTRADISNEISSVIDEFGPKLYGNHFNQRRIVHPAAGPPPGQPPALGRRRSNTSGVDAQGNLLIHPMTWLDERVFGWTHSNKSSASTSRETSRTASPVPSDDEDDEKSNALVERGDWDDVIGMLNAHEKRRASRSYASR
ncbi:hypothetical protein DACRYDRAFT_118608 [Dacryopinax primogenitus]|uniref:Phospholipid/glycerol acyltransferase domain-containing protein n=1 Tax=Dacryopinax primogenitus (strain DJM 731) TaxID=1858805 RepID=M5FXQ5_DACPD|nr:uncharacterized protein DACRYDRAFT_118608 [Dacryopinax primogenitus]EJT98296.1 hypothetical protein DACRYDRAFT_118608 [Dacryopinax primogenitus]